MSGVIVWATAVYRSGQPAEITVIPQATGIPETVDYQHAGPAPNKRALVTTRWAAVPGQEWHEDDGVWSVSVFRHEN